MSVPRSGPLWRSIFVELLIGTIASYVYYSQREFPHGGSAWGLGYGIAGSALILLLAFFGVRKRWYRSTFGTLEQWLQSHIYLGVLVLVILFFHAGRSEEHTSELQSLAYLVCRLLLEKKNTSGAVLPTV